MEYFERATRYPLLEDFLAAEPEIEFVRHIWVDFSGILRQRILITKHCRELHGSGSKYGVSPRSMMKTVTDTDDKLGFQKQQRFNIIPDWTSIRVCHFSPGHAWVMCFVQCEEERDPFIFCPRYLLAKVLERARNETDAEFLIGCETEFMLMDQSMQPIQTLDNSVSWSSLGGLRDRKLAMVEEVIRTLQRSSIEVCDFHAEDPDQLEFATYPYGPMQSIDALYYTQECLRVTALRYNYRATVAIKPLLGSPTSTVGLHFSISRTDITQDHFLAGVLSKLPDILPFAMPTYDSYRRASVDRKGTWICWGTQNRDTPVRKVGEGHWEFRLPDATANFYMLLSVLLSAGLDGVRDAQPLKWKDLRFKSQCVSEAELSELGITKRLPSTFRDALEYLKKSQYVENLMGAEMKRFYVLAKEWDEENLCRMSDDERRRAYISVF